MAIVHDLGPRTHHGAGLRRQDSVPRANFHAVLQRQLCRQAETVPQTGGPRPRALACPLAPTDLKSFSAIAGSLVPSPRPAWRCRPPHPHASEDCPQAGRGPAGRCGAACPGAGLRRLRKARRSIASRPRVRSSASAGVAFGRGPQPIRVVVSFQKRDYRILVRLPSQRLVMFVAAEKLSFVPPPHELDTCRTGTWKISLR